MAVTGVLPAVAGDLVGAADAAGGEDDRFGAENFESAALAIIAKCAHHAPVPLQESEDGVLHVDINALVHAVVLESANHFQAGAIADMREPGIFVTAEITLEANPDDITTEKLAAWKGEGINRLSIGIQSFFEEELVWMNRAHNAGQAERCIEQSLQAGFHNFSIDLIYGSPLLTDDMWQLAPDASTALMASTQPSKILARL